MQCYYDSELGTGFRSGAVRVGGHNYSHCVTFRRGLETTLNFRQKIAKAPAFSFTYGAEVKQRETNQLQQLVEVAS